MRLLPPLACAFLALSLAASAAATVKGDGTGSALGAMRSLAQAFQASRPDVQVVIVPGLGSSGGIKAAAAGPGTLALILSERRPLRALPVNGVMPSVAALARGVYAYSKPLYLVTAPHPSEAARAFAAFVRSEQGARILLDNAYLPVK